MTFEDTPLAGLLLVRPIIHRDDRGSFFRTYCAQTFADRGLTKCGEQWSLSHNHRRGTLRGLHYQADLYGETKLVRCAAGAIFDVVVDIRPESSTYSRYHAIVLTASEPVMVYVPAGFAHGFMTLVDDSVVEYAISPPYVPEASRGIRWDTPALAIPWPMVPTVLSARDAQLPPWPA